MLLAPLLLALAMVLVSAPCFCARAETPDYAGFGGAVFLPYVNAPPPGQPITRRPRLRVSFGGETRAALLDTGSTSVVVSASLIPNLGALPHLGSGELVYSGSGRIARGTWVMSPVTLSGADGTKITTRPLPVLAVSDLACLPKARFCRPKRHPRDVAVIGVGFAREHDHQSFGTPDHNPFLNLPGMGDPQRPGAVRRGYLVRRDGVLVGLDAANAAGFSFVKLEKDPVYPDWAAVPACISIAGRLPPACGTMLMDTGAGKMYLRLPAAQRDGVSAAGKSPVLSAGTSVDVTVSGAPGISYAFTVGAPANPLVPDGAILAGDAANPKPFVNTSFHMLNGFDYLYDADGGFAGFRARQGR